MAIDHRGSRFAVALTAVLLLGASPAAPQSAPPAAPAAQIAPTTGPGRHFEAVRRHLDLGGPLFVYVEVDGEIEALAKRLTEAIAAAAGDEPEAQRFKQDYAALAAELGLTDVKAVGMSSVARPGGSFHNRAFYLLPEPRRGVFAVLGGPARPFATARLAPADTDLFIETEIDLPALLDTMTAVARRFDPAAGLDTAGAALADATGIDAGPALDALAALRGRVTLALRLADAPPPDSGNLDEWAVELMQKGQLLIRAEGLGSKLAEVLDTVDLLVAETAGGRRIYRPREPIPQLGDNQPAIAIEGEAVLIASSLAFLQASLARSDGLDAAPPFRAALAATGLEQGNTVVYGTPRAFAFVRSAIEGIAGATAPGEEAASAISAILERVPRLDSPLAAVAANLPDGIALHANGDSTLRGALLPVALWSPDILGTVVLAAAPAAVRAIVEVKREERRVAAIENNLRVIGEAAQRFFARDTRAGEVGFEDLRAELEGKLTEIPGLDFSDFTLERGFSRIDYDLADGRKVSWIAPLGDADREAVKRNLAAFDRVAVWYFRRFPDEGFMAGFEAVQTGSPMREFPKPVRDENYRNLQISKGDTEIQIEVAGERITIPRQPPERAPAQRPQRQQQQRQGQPPR